MTFSSRDMKLVLHGCKSGWETLLGENINGNTTFKKVIWVIYKLYEFEGHNWKTCSHNSKYQWVFKQIFQLNIAISIVSVSKIHYRVYNSSGLHENTRYKLCLQRLQRNLRMLSTKSRNWRDCMILFTCYVQLILKTQSLTVLHQQNVVHHLRFKLFSLVSSPIYSR